jgi:hypothetical protein
VIWHHGITPEVVVSLPPEATPLIPSAEKDLTAEELRKSKDVQLLRALDLLQKNNGKEKALPSSSSQAFEML